MEDHHQNGLTNPYVRRLFHVTYVNVGFIIFWNVNTCRIRKEKHNKNLRRTDVQPPEPPRAKSLPKVNNLQPLNAEPNFGMTVTPVFQCSGNAENVRLPVSDAEAVFANERMLKPLGDLYQTGTEWREMAEMISKEIVMTDLNVHWDDIEGLDECKSLLKEATVYPMKYPELFGGKLAPWQGILLYGPPGTGSALLKLSSTRVEGSPENHQAKIPNQISSSCRLAG